MLKRVIIGGSSEIPGWITMNADPSTNPDILSDICDLKNVEENSVSVFYLSHVLEHIPLFKVEETLKKLFNAMTKHGSLFISVPDLNVLSDHLRDTRLGIDQKIHTLRMIYGGQVSDYDFHYFGYTFEVLSYFLDKTGFKNIEKVRRFNLHNDTSNFAPYFETPISLNVICHKL
jgi:predicted SAM-dependent methyltransferase